MDEIYWLWLTFVNGIGPVTGHKLIEIYGTAKIIYENRNKLKVKDPDQRDKEAMERAERVYEECNNKNILIITCENDTYRSVWESKRDFPFLLYSKGNSDWINKKRIGIVGARRCSAMGKLRTISLASEAVGEKKLVVSGLAKGIDSYAHTAAIKNGGKTIAILGSGVDICYPSEHEKLYQAICENGAVVSEYPPGTIPQRYYFPRRNRLIAGLSEKLYVIEAGKNSGTRSTVEATLKYGGEVQYF